MLKFILNEETTEKVVYEYFPENGSESGFIAYDKTKDEFSIISLPKIDRHRRYAQKMFSKIREWAAGNTYQKEGIVAWY